MRSTTLRLPALALLTLLGSTLAQAQTPLQTAFTYQGVLSFGGMPQTGTFDFEFRLYDQDCQTPPACPPSIQIGPTISMPGVAVTNGLFTVELNFGNVFNADQYWLEPWVNYAGMLPLRQLPRQRLSANPYAFYATKSDWFGLSNVPAGFADNIDDDTQYSAGSGLSLAGTTFSIATGGVTNAMLGVDVVTTDKIETGAVKNTDIDFGAVTTDKISGAGAALGQVLTYNGSVVWSTPASGLTLPYSGSVNSGSPALTLTNTGTGRVGHFEILNASNNNNAFFVHTNGTGTAGTFWCSNAANGSDALYAENGGTGRAGRFLISNSASTSDALYSRTSGPGRAGHFQTTNASSNLPALYGQTNSTNTFATGVRGDCTASSGPGVGVRGESTAPSGSGVVGIDTNGAGSYGVYASGGGYGLYAIKVGGGNYGIYSSGNCHVQGTLSKSAGSFKIDHPLDPANRYLSHSFVESPDMMNVYNGNVQTDEQGYATIELPGYFEALNRDFRYQLTVIDDADSDVFAQVKVVRSIANNRFTIRASAAKVTVSWQVTGIRHDPYANAHRIPVEEDKPEATKGYYEHPAVYGLPEDRNISRTHSHPVPDVAAAAQEVVR